MVVEGFGIGVTSVIVGNTASELKTKESAIKPKPERMGTNFFMKNEGVNNFISVFIRKNTFVKFFYNNL